MENKRCPDESGTNKRVSPSDHTVAGPSTQSDQLINYSLSPSGVNSHEHTIDDVEFFLATQQPHGVKRKLSREDDDDFDHTIKKRQCRLVEPQKVHGAKRKHDIDINPGSTKTRRVAGDRKRGVDDENTNGKGKIADRYDERKHKRDKHNYCYCRKPKLVIAPIQHELRQASPMRKQLLKRLTMASFRTHKFCCKRHCCRKWKKVSAQAVYRDYE